VTTDGTPTSSAGTRTATGAAPGSSSDSAPSSDTTPPSAAPVAAAVPGAGDAVLTAVNGARAQKGCAALTADADLTSLAEDHSAQMTKAGSLDAAGPAGRTTTVARGTKTAAAVADAWLADASDRSVLLDCSRTAIGVAEATGNGGPWWTAVLG
jgi:uncharacterized protein YkwD